MDDKIKATQKRYYEKNADKKKAYAKEYYEKNKATILARMKKSREQASDHVKIPVSEHIMMLEDIY